MKRIVFKSIILCIALNFFPIATIWATGSGISNQNIGIFKANNNNNNVSVNNISAINRGINPGDDPNGINDPIGGEAPIGDGLGIISSLGLIYGCFVFLRKKK